MTAIRGLLLPVILAALFAIKDIEGCSTFHDVLNCRSMLDTITSRTAPACTLAETCLKNLSCCCTVDMPYQQKIRCSVRKRDIGYEIFRLNYICKLVVVQQPNIPGC